MTAAELDEGAQAWMGYWAGFGSVNSVTKTTHIISTARGWKADGAEITNLYAALPAPASGGAAAWRVGRDAVGWVLCKTLAEAEDEWLGPPDEIEPLYPSPASGAAEMRERAAAKLEDLAASCDPDDYDEQNDAQALRHYAKVVRALPLTEPGSGDQ